LVDHPDPEGSRVNALYVYIIIDDDSMPLPLNNECINIQAPTETQGASSKHFVSGKIEKESCNK
jgi:hypothetical protein